MSLAVGFAMAASYILSSTFVPVCSMWLLRSARGLEEVGKHARRGLFDRLRRGYELVLRGIVAVRWLLVPLYLAGAGAVIWYVGRDLGLEIFPGADAPAFRLRLRAADGSHFGKTEQIAKAVLDSIAQTAGPDNLEQTLGYVGTIPSSYPINAVFQWSRGPEEAILLVAFKRQAGIAIEPLKEQLRDRLSNEFPGVRFSFEPADIINEVMSFGSPTPIEVAVSGPSFAENRVYAQRLYQELGKIQSLRDLQFAQSLDYPTIEVNVDRQKAGLVGVTTADVAESLVTATSSSRFVVPNYWADPKTGIGYQVQVEVPRPIVRSPGEIQPIASVADLDSLPIKHGPTNSLLLRDVAELRRGTMPGQFDRYNMRRQVGLTANVAGEDLGRVSRRVAAALAAAGDPPRGSKVEVRGQIPPMQEMLGGLGIGLAMSIVTIFLLLAANFQSIRLSLAAISTAPAAVAGVVLTLRLTGDTLNIQSFTGSIMAIGVAMANAILLITFAERRRRDGQPVSAAAVIGAGSRLRAILMTACAMTAGMVPMALAFGEAGRQNAPLGRAVVGGLLAATAATLFILPCVFALLQKRAPVRSASLDPDDPASSYFAKPTAHSSHEA
jgi:multidrug efflux pump subunit AcrB